MKCSITVSTVFLLCAAPLIGCDESLSTPTTGWDGVVRDSAGIQIVENFGTPLWPEGETWEFTEVLRIGLDTGAEEYEFGRISGLVVLSDRRVVVADAMGHHVKYFSPEGVHERTVGTFGRGPGDFGAYNLALFQGPGDTLLVLDQQNNQGHTLAPDGTWLGSFSTRKSEGYQNAERWDDDPQTGRLVSRVRPLTGGPISDKREFVLLRDVHGAVLDTVAFIPPTRGASMQGDVRTYFPGLPTSALCCGVLVTGRSDEYRLLWYDLDGTLGRIVSLGREPLALTEEDQSVLMGQFELDWQERRYSPQRVEREKERIRFASTYPAYNQRLFTGPGSTLLVNQVRPLRDFDANERNTPRYIGQASPNRSPTWDVFDSEGRYLGEVVLQGERPGSGRWGDPQWIRFARDQTTDTWYMYSILHDEMDVEYIVGWRIDGPMPGSTDHPRFQALLEEYADDVEH